MIVPPSEDELGAVAERRRGAPPVVTKPMIYDTKMPLRRPRPPPDAAAHGSRARRADRRGHRRHLHRRRVRRRRRPAVDPQGRLDASRLRSGRGRGRRDAPRATARSGPATEVIHGTTVATNAILERRGARTALITTAGLPRRPRAPAGALARSSTTPRYVPPPPLVERRWRVEVAERIGRRRRRPDPARRGRGPPDASPSSRRRASRRSRSACSTRSAIPAHERAIGRLLEAHVGLHLAVGRPAAGDRRVRADEHDRRQRVHRPDRVALPARARDGPAADRRRSTGSR